MNSKANDLTCEDTTWLVSDSRERELTETEKRDLESHIEDCELCQGASKQFGVLFRQVEAFLARDEDERNAS